MNKGILTTLKIHRAKDVEGENGVKIFGVRIMKFLPEGWVHFGEATPDKKLLFKFKELEKKGEWNRDTFLNIYFPEYVKQIKSNSSAMEEIKKIGEFLNEGINVYYACYCSEHQLCHRSIIADIFERNGYTVIRK